MDHLYAFYFPRFVRPSISPLFRSVSSRNVYECAVDLHSHTNIHRIRIEWERWLRRPRTPEIWNRVAVSRPFTRSFRACIRRIYSLGSPLLPHHPKIGEDLAAGRRTLETCTYGVRRRKRERERERLLRTRVAFTSDLISYPLMICNCREEDLNSSARRPEKVKWRGAKGWGLFLYPLLAFCVAEASVLLSLGSSARGLSVALNVLNPRVRESPHFYIYFRIYGTVNVMLPLENNELVYLSQSMV